MQKEFKILLVEDDLEAASELMFALKDTHLDIIHADDGKMGLELFKIYNPKLVISDIKMQVMDGIAMGIEIKKLKKETPLLYMSAYSDSEYILKAINIGADGYILKPINLELLIEKIGEIRDRVESKQKIDRANHQIGEYLKVLDTSVILSKTNPEGIITYANDAFVSISGYTREELIGSNHNIIRHPDMPAQLFKELWESIENRIIWKGVIKNRCKDGSDYTVESTVVPILDEDGSILEYMALRYDISKIQNHNIYLQDVASRNEKLALRKSQEMIESLLIDEMTKISNVLALKKELLKRGKGALMLLDINNFNMINKLHGFAYGDKILKICAKHLNNLLPIGAHLYKMSGDRFAILLDEYDEKFLKELSVLIFAYFDSLDIEVDMQESVVSFSIGASQIDLDADVIVESEFALEASKQKGSRFLVIYKKDIADNERESIKNLYRVRELLSRDKIVPYYQPIVDAKTRKIYKFESLARIVDRDILMAPGEFLDEVARLGLFTTLTKMMINKTFEHFGNTHERFSINITEQDLKDGYILEFLKLKAKKYNIDLKQVTFEILENLTIKDGKDLIRDRLLELKKLGCHLAIDDFGSDRSNFARILSLKCDYLKIDGVFIRGCDEDSQKREIIEAIVQLAKKLGIKTVAEYVSSKSIFETIKELGVDYAQGYYFGMPTPWDEI